MQPTAEQLGLEFFAIITQFQWRRVAIIEQNENLFTVVSCLQWCEHAYLDISHVIMESVTNVARCRAWGSMHR